MHIIHAYKKLTHKYNPAWAHLDESEYMGFDLKIVYGKARYSDDGESVKTIAYATASKPVTKSQMYQMLHAFDRSCRCEHDCCGHFNGGARYSGLKKVSRNGRKWAIPIIYSANV
jgi:hypothetical protein